MNTLLLKNKPDDISKEEFNKLWDNAGYTLRALYSTLEELKASFEIVKPDDFDCPNHYAKLAFQAGMARAYDQIMQMLPNSAKS